MKRTLAIAIVSVLGLGACGTHLTKAQLSAAAAKQGSPAASAKANASNGSASTGISSSGSGRAVQPGRTTPLPAVKPTTNAFPIHMHLNNACASPGTKMQAAIATVPASRLGMYSYYPADNGFAPDIFYVPSDTNASGSFTWTWVLRPNTPLGEAVVKVLADKNGRSAVVTQNFRVARTC